MGLGTKDFDYIVPTTQQPNQKVPGGVLPKEEKKAKVASTAPGPGQYSQHVNWKEPRTKTLGGTKPSNPQYTIPETPRDKGLKMNKVPGVGTYDKKLGVTHPRVVGGIASRSVKHSFLDGAVYQSHQTPGPGLYKLEKVHQYTDKHVQGISFNPPKTESRREKPKPVPGPGNYKVNYDLTEKRMPQMIWEKKVQKTFTEEIALAKKNIPGVGHYEPANLKKISRGAKILQMNPTESPRLAGKY
jgi:hypothetical protein